jgi:hypothetical protein
MEVSLIFMQRNVLLEIKRFIIIANIITQIMKEVTVNNIKLMWLLEKLRPENNNIQI